MTPTSRETVLARTLVQLADSLVDDFDVIELLTVLVDRCVDLLRIDAAGLMLVSAEGDLRGMASSSEAMRILELFELQSEEGPCFDSYRSGTSLVNQDLAANHQRWPRFAAMARDTGFRKAHALPVRLRGSVMGALNLFATNDAALSHDDIEAGQAMADIATIAVLQQRATTESRILNEQLNHALSSRIAIEQAKGMISERRGIDMAQAFSLLRAHARGHNRQLAAVAAALIDGSLPDSSL